MNTSVIINTRNKVEMNIISITTLLLMCSIHASAATPAEGDKYNYNSAIVTTDN
jgi:hypothetical protein